MSESYNGWKNRETWAVSLHIGNDESLMTEAHHVAHAAWEDALEEDADAGEVEHALTVAQDAVEEWVSDLLSPSYWAENYGSDMPEGIELMREDVGSLWRVDWREVTAGILEDELDSARYAALGMGVLDG